MGKGEKFTVEYNGKRVEFMVSNVVNGIYSIFNVEGNITLEGITWDWLDQHGISFR